MPNIDNEFQLIPGKNMGNSSHAMQGRAAFVRPVQHPIFRTKQSAYRFIGWLESMVDGLPDEDEAASADEIREAIRQGMR